jgi:putative endopeptidase
MKRNQLHFLVLIVAFTASQCKSGKSDSSKPDIITNTNNVVKPDVVATVNVEPEYSYNSVKESVDFQFMDPSVDPKVDFYNYANGIWMKENPVPSTEDRWTNFSTLLKNNNDRLLEILTDASKMKNEPGTVNQLIGDMYHSIMDSTTRNKAGVTPLKPHLDKISGLKDIKKLADISGDLHSKGVRFLFDVSIDQDLKNNTRNMIYIGQGGMSLPTKDFYTKTDSSSVAIRTEFKKHVSLLFQEIGYDEKKANATAETVQR